jgi:hypothetical protein
VDAAYTLANSKAEELLSAQQPSRAVDYKRQPALSAQALMSKRARTDAHVLSPAPSPAPSSPPPSSQHSPSPASQRSPSPSLPHSEPLAAPVYITTVTNNNRRAELQREKKHKATLEKKQLAITLVALHATLWLRGFGYAVYNAMLFSTSYIDFNNACSETGLSCA